LKPERWGSLLVQEKYREEKACDKKYSYRIIIIIIIIIIIMLLIMRIKTKEEQAHIYGQKSLGSHSNGSCVGSRAGMVTLEKRKCLDPTGIRASSLRPSNR